MKLTKGQKISAGVLAVCLTALGIDRAFLGPQTSKASDNVEELIEASASTAETAGEETESIEDVDLIIPESVAASNLRVIRTAMLLDPENVKDAFRQPDSWMLTAPEETKSQPQRMTAQQFKRQYILEATMVADEESYAIVDGQLLRIGEKIDGWILVSVADRSAVFESYEIFATLEQGKSTDKQKPDNRRQ